MKTMNKYLVVATGIMMLAGTLRANQAVNIDFQPNNTNGVGYEVDYSGAGAYDDGTNVWNMVGPVQTNVGPDESGGWFEGGYTCSNLVDSTGANSGMNFYTWDGDFIAFRPETATYTNSFANDAKGLMGDYISIFADAWSRAVFVEGLATNQAYDLYLYGSGPWGRNTKFDVRCDTDMNKNWGFEQWVGSATTTGSGTSHNLTLGTDYVKFTFTTGADKDTLWIEYTGVLPDNGASFNGLQLVALDYVPHPPEFLEAPTNQVLVVGSNYAWTVTATNAVLVDDVISLSAEWLSAGATFDPVVGTNGVSGTLNWTPTESGWQTITFVATNSDGSTSASTTFDVRSQELTEPIVSVLNLDFQPGAAGVAGGGHWSTTYFGQGALPDPGNDLWNSVDPLITDSIVDVADESGGEFWGGSFAGLINSDGSASVMTVTIPTNDIASAYAHPASNPNYWVFADDAKGLMADYFLVFGATRSLFIEGLTPGTPYELCLYGMGQWNRDTQFSIRCDTNTAMSFATAQWIGSKRTDAIEASHNLTENIDYVRFRFTPDAGMDTLWIEYTNASGSDSCPFNGLQLAALVPAGPQDPPVITGLSVSGTDVSLSWTDDGKGTYTIMRKTDLTAATWDNVVSNLPAGLGTTNVTASAANQEFYQIKGE